MTKKTKLVWRLGKLPNVEEIQNLVKDKIITQEEAREILFNSETAEDRDKTSLENEIKFLRELVEKLSKDRTKIVEVIKEIKTYPDFTWYQPYSTWCSSGNNLALYPTTSEINNCSNPVTGLSNCSFTDIKTF